MFVITFLAYAVLAVYEFVPLYKEKQWPDVILNAVLWVISLSIAMMLCFNVQISSPQDLIKEIITSIF